MNSVDFCFWLQGFFEISDTHELTPKQVEIIKNHLNLVFVHEIDPLRESQTIASKNELDCTHSSLTLPDQHAGVTPPYSGRLETGNDMKMRC